MLIINLFLFLLSSLVLIFSAIFLVKSLGKIARHLKISEFTVAFIIMAFATAIPELFVGISSAISGVPNLSLGNVLGSSILHLTLLMGIFVLMARGIKIKEESIGKDVYLVFISIFLLTILFWIGKSLSRIDGLILLSFFAFCYYKIFKKRKKYPKKLKGKQQAEIIKITIIFILSIIALFLSSHSAVKYASLIATQLKVPEIIIGLFLLSFATTLPELTFGFEAIKLGHKEMALGDLIGGVLTNIGLIAGLVAIIEPIKASFFPFIISSIFLLLSAFILIKFMKSDKKLKMKEGITLILLYILFIFLEFFLK